MYLFQHTASSPSGPLTLGARFRFLVLQIILKYVFERLRQSVLFVIDAFQNSLPLVDGLAHGMGRQNVHIRKTFVCAPA